MPEITEAGQDDSAGKTICGFCGVQIDGKPQFRGNRWWCGKCPEELVQATLNIQNENTRPEEQSSAIPPQATRTITVKAGNILTKDAEITLNDLDISSVLFIKQSRILPPKISNFDVLDVSGTVVSYNPIGIVNGPISIRVLKDVKPTHSVTIRNELYTPYEINAIITDPDIVCTLFLENAGAIQYGISNYIVIDEKGNDVTYSPIGIVGGRLIIRPAKVRLSYGYTDAGVNPNDAFSGQRERAVTEREKKSNGMWIFFFGIFMMILAGVIATVGPNTFVCAGIMVMFGVFALIYGLFIWIGAVKSPF